MDEMKWNTGPQFNTEASYFSIPTDAIGIGDSNEVTDGALKQLFVRRWRDSIWANGEPGN